MSGTDEAPNWQPARVAPLTWKELDWLRSLTTLPLVLRGSQPKTRRLPWNAASVAYWCRRMAGANGRHAECVSLPEIVEVCTGRAEVYLDPASAAAVMCCSPGPWGPAVAWAPPVLGPRG
jgi:hypothetical protein